MSRPRPPLLVERRASRRRASGFLRVPELRGDLRHRHASAILPRRSDAEVVRVAVHDPGRLARPRHHVLRDVRGEAGEHPPLGRPVLARAASPRPRASATRGLRPSGAPQRSSRAGPGTGTRPRRRRPIRARGASPTRIPVCSSTRSGNRHRAGTCAMIVSTSAAVGGSTTVRLLARQPDAAVAGGVRVDAREVEQRAERRQVAADRRRLQRQAARSTPARRPG